jgi:arsenate reductase
MYTIYHNPRCKKSRAGLAYLQENGIEHQVREYLKDPLSEEELQNLLMKLNKKPLDMIRTQEEYYKKQLKGLRLTDEEYLKEMVAHPKLIQRPIVEGKYKAVVGRSPWKTSTGYLRQPFGALSDRTS